MPRLVSAAISSRRKPELGEDFGGMFADRRRLPAQREIVLADFDRQARQFGAHAVRRINLEHAATGIELRIVEQIAGLGDRRERNIDTVENSASSASLCRAMIAGDDRPQRRPRVRRGPRWFYRPGSPGDLAGRNARRSAAIGRRW